jgi:ubiquinone/menaquinone biosynthesis C-methylase UbiE
MHELFEAQVHRAPDATALVYDGKELTYREVEDRSNQLARLLRDRGVGPEVKVGVCLERSFEMIITVLAIGKAGGAYVPLEPAWPRVRAEQILGPLAARMVITERKHLHRFRELQYLLPDLHDVVCIDETGERLAPEEVVKDQVEAFFDDMSARAFDEATAGGFISSFTGQPFPLEEVHEYREHVVSLVRKHLPAGGRVLEVGCGSGLILFALADGTIDYVGLDPSDETQRRNRERAQREEIRRLELITGFADQLDDLALGQFDVVLMASTAQFFPGLAYLDRVIEQCMRACREGGVLILADMIEYRVQEQVQTSV